MGLLHILFPPNVGKLEARKDITALIKCLGSRNHRINIEAIHVLARIGEPAIDYLISALGDRDERVSKNASGALQLMGDLAVRKLALTLRDKDEQLRNHAAATLAHIRYKTAVDALISAWEENHIDTYLALASLESVTGWRHSSLDEWKNWWDQYKTTWKYEGQEADHFIIRMYPPEPANPEFVINEILTSNGYRRGTATVDFKVETSIDDAYMTALTLKYAEQSRIIVDERRSKFHDFTGKATGKLAAIYVLMKRPKDLM